MTTAIEDIAQVVNGGTPKTNVPEYWDGRHLWITPAEMGRLDSPYIAISRRKLTDAGLQNSSASLVPKNSVILSTRAPIGHLVINDEPMAFNQGCRGLVPRQQVHYKYLYYFLFSSVDLLNELGSGTTFKELAAGKLKKVKVPLPPIPEQKRIVAILDEAFAAIATAVANTEKNLANARELFESYLNAVFLKGAHVWTRRRLEEVCEKITVGHVGSMATRYKPEGIPLLRSQNIRPFRVDLENVVYIDEEFHSELKKSALKPGDLGIVRTGYPGTAAVIPDTLPISNCSDLVIVRPGDQVLSSFLALVFNSTFGKQTVAGVLVGAAQKHFNVTAAKAALVPIPSREEQARVVVESSEVRQECEKLEAICQQKLDALAELKHSLLQKAFSGELTAVPQDEIETALA